MVNIDSQIVNSVFAEAAAKNQLKHINDYFVLWPEKTYNSSRFDFYYESKGQKGFIEVKGVTLEKGNHALFPDAPTARGRKHLKDLVNSAEEGFRSYIIFIIQMNNIRSFGPNWETDPEFSKALKEAREKGVEVSAWDTMVYPHEISLNRQIEVIL